VQRVGDGECVWGQRGGRRKAGSIWKNGEGGCIPSVVLSRGFHGGGRGSSMMMMMMMMRGCE
jgi:hypothetical protein